MASKPSPTVRSVFLAWEKLRVVYNALLIPLVVVLLFTASRDWDPDCPPAWAGNEAGQLNWPLALVQCVVWGLMSNVCFFLGPTTEAYASWLGWRSAVLRYVLFSLGTLFTAIAAVEVVMFQLGMGPGFQ